MTLISKNLSEHQTDHRDHQKFKILHFQLLFGRFVDHFDVTSLK